MLSGSITVREAAEAMLLGAHYVLEKPASAEALVAASARRRKPPPEMPLDATLDEVRIAHIKHVLTACHGNVSEAARRLEIDRRTIQRLLDGKST